MIQLVNGLHNINNFIPIQSLNELQNIKKTESKKNNEFTSILEKSINKVNDNQIKANNITESFIKGEGVEVHDVMLAQEEAKMSLELAVQVRNRVVETIQELSRMQL